jgi:hypothetical protein
MAKNPKAKTRGRKVETDRKENKNFNNLLIICVLNSFYGEKQPLLKFLTALAQGSTGVL